MTATPNRIYTPTSGKNEDIQPADIEVQHLIIGKGGRGHCAVYYNGPQNFMMTLSYSLA